MAASKRALKQAEEALGGHSENCRWFMNENAGHRCTCGLDAKRQAVAALVDATEQEVIDVAVFMFGDPTEETGFSENDLREELFISRYGQDAYLAMVAKRPTAERSEDADG